MMGETPLAVVSVRQCSQTENVYCAGPHLEAWWAKYVVDLEQPRQLRRRMPEQMFMCQRCCEEFLSLADGWYAA